MWLHNSWGPSLPPLEAPPPAGALAGPGQGLSLPRKAVWTMRHRSTLLGKTGRTPAPCGVMPRSKRHLPFPSGMPSSWEVCNLARILRGQWALGPRTRGVHGAQETLTDPGEAGTQHPLHRQEDQVCPWSDSRAAT